MIRARMFAIACGYEDCDDLDVVRFDPALKLACGRVAETGDDLMSQPTLSRLENAPSWRQPGRMTGKSKKARQGRRKGSGGGGRTTGPQALRGASPYHVGPQLPRNRRLFGEDLLMAVSWVV